VTQRHTRQVGPVKFSDTIAPVDDRTREMALRCYGYGRWEAPYWFIGPEQGQGNETLECRVEAWTALGAKDLCDCREFSERICDDRWHRPNPKPQNTWMPLICLLMGFLGRSTNKESLIAYQRDRWGMLDNGETCVIELLGLPAKSLKTPRDRKTFRAERIDVIRDKIRVHRPKLVVMYGKSHKNSWDQIALPRAFSEDNVIVCDEGTILFYARHPTNGGPARHWWEDRGKMLRETSQTHFTQF